MELHQEETYKYLEVDEGDEIQHANMEEKRRKRDALSLTNCVKAVLQTELNTKKQTS